MRKGDPKGEQRACVARDPLGKWRFFFVPKPAPTFRLVSIKQIRILTMLEDNFFHFFYKEIISPAPRSCPDCVNALLPERQLPT